MTATQKRLYRELLLLVTICALLIVVSRASGHCDTLNGPVALAARAALENGDVTPVLKWVSTSDEAEVRSALARARVVRVQGDDARALADQFFLETIVRFHRATEGMPFTGIKRDAGEVAPVIAAADQALADDDVEPLVRLMTGRIARQLRERFRAAAAGQKRQNDTVAEGRAFVRTYVDFMHYVERLCQAAISDHGHQHAAGGERSIAQR